MGVVRALKGSSVGAAAVMQLALAGCFVDPGDGETASTAAGATESTTTSTTATTTTTATTATTTTTATTSDATTTTGAARPACGDGELDPGEACDDGNQANDDLCLASCEAASCDDGFANQGESDIDCGGPCAPCELCSACASDDACASGRCVDGRCSYTFEIKADWVANCGLDGDTSTWAVQEGIPAGTYLAVALESAGAAWAPPYNPPQNGWSWRINCDQVEFAAMLTPQGVYFATAAEAFANLQSGEEPFEFAGGALRCGRSDISCSDNQGSTAFVAARQCE